MIAFTLAMTCVAFSSAFSLVIRRESPYNWPPGSEPYDVFHSRYITLGCQDKPNQQFFDLCCHPLLESGNSGVVLPSLCAPAHEHGSSIASLNAEFGAASKISSIKPINAAFTIDSPLPASITSDALISGGFATFYYQNGIPGACGVIHGDYDMIAAMDHRRYGNVNTVSELCGKMVKITNPANNKSVIVTIVDACPTCNNDQSIDLSVGAFQQIAPLEQGLVSINWIFV